MVDQLEQIEDVRGSGVHRGKPPLPPAGEIFRVPVELGHPDQWQRSTGSVRSIETPALAAGRAIFGGYFLYNGINHFVNREMLAPYAASQRVPAPDVAVAASGLLAI